MSYEGKVVWLTGASSGIGEALARALAQQGARLILSARRKDRLERLREACAGKGGRAEVLPFDQEETASLEAVVQEAERLGPVEVAVLNAGIGQSSRALETRLDVVERILRVNTLGTIAVASALVPRMLARGGGHLVVTSSVLGKFGVQRRSAYAASKHALHGYFDALRCELAGTPIKISLICPGWVSTELEERALREDGSPKGETRTGKDGMKPEAFARRMIAAMRREAEEAYIGGPEVAAVWLKRWAPSLLGRILPRQPID